MIGLFVAVFFVSFAVISSADWGHSKKMNASSIKTLRDSASALQTSNPDLSKQLTELADLHEKTMMKQKAAHDEKLKVVQDAAVALQMSNPDLAKGLNDYTSREMKETEGAEPAEMEENESADIKLFRDSAAALQTSNPNYADKLTMYANKKEVKMRWMEEEAGEKIKAAAEKEKLGM